MPPPLQCPHPWQRLRIAAAIGMVASLISLAVTWWHLPPEPLVPTPIPTPTDSTLTPSPSEIDWTEVPWPSPPPPSSSTTPLEPTAFRVVAYHTDSLVDLERRAGPTSPWFQALATAWRVTYTGIPKHWSSGPDAPRFLSVAWDTALQLDPTGGVHSVVFPVQPGARSNLGFFQVALDPATHPDPSLRLTYLAEVPSTGNPVAIRSRPRALPATSRAWSLHAFPPGQLASDPSTDPLVTTVIEAWVALRRSEPAVILLTESPGPAAVLVEPKGRSSGTLHWLGFSPPTHWDPKHLESFLASGISWSDALPFWRHLQRPAGLPAVHSVLGFESFAPAEAHEGARLLAALLENGLHLATCCFRLAPPGAPAAIARAHASTNDSGHAVVHIERVGPRTDPKGRLQESLPPFLRPHSAEPSRWTELWNRRHPAAPIPPVDPHPETLLRALQLSQASATTPAWHLGNYAITILPAALARSRLINDHGLPPEHVVDTKDFTPAELRDLERALQFLPESELRSLTNLAFARQSRFPKASGPDHQIAGMTFSTWVSSTRSSTESTRLAQATIVLYDTRSESEDPIRIGDGESKFTGTILHEIGHVLGGMRFQRPFNAHFLNHPVTTAITWYAASDPEDELFPEVYMLWRLAPAWLQRHHPALHTWMSNHLPGAEGFTLAPPVSP